MSESQRSRRIGLRSFSFSDVNRAVDYIVHLESTKEKLLEQEDTTNNKQITIKDQGPKLFRLGTLRSDGFRQHSIRGNYAVSNLLQEIAREQSKGKEFAVIKGERLTENPVTRLERSIRDHFWCALVRCIDEEHIYIASEDSKDRCEFKQRRIYIPFDDEKAWNYFLAVQHRRPEYDLQVLRLPQKITAEYVHELNDKPGILSLGLTDVEDVQGHVRTQGIPFLVPGGRFNEMYGWDSYFIADGLLADNFVHLAKSCVDNLVYEINHYGKILNANRTYYLNRSQPPFLTSMIRKVYEKMPQDHSWLRKALLAAIQEYHNVWMSEPRFVPSCGLSRYFSEGIGIPPETEASHFDALLKPYAEKLKVDIKTYFNLYQSGKIQEPDLDEYFMHDRAVRESGHDTTYRLDGVCAHLCVFELNCLLYKYEKDIEYILNTYFEGEIQFEDGTISSTFFKKQAENRKEKITEYCWDEETGLFYDYNFKTGQKSTYRSVTCLYGLWSGCVSKEQAARLMYFYLMCRSNIHLWEMVGGLSSGCKESIGHVALDKPSRQWDYPFGWAPHQILAWEGLAMYGYDDIVHRLAYKWLYTITKAFVDYNGVVPEKFDVVKVTHEVDVEYGNVGTDFKYVVKEGFGWMNASYQIGLQFLNVKEKRSLGALIHPHSLFKK